MSKLSRPAFTRIDAPSLSMASSSSSGVFVAVPSVSISARRLDTPTRASSSSRRPPRIRRWNCTSGISRSSMTRTCRPLARVSWKTSGGRTDGGSPNGGSMLLSNDDGVRGISPRSTTTISASAPWTIGSSTTSAFCDPSSANSSWPRGTKLAATYGRPLMYFSYAAITSSAVTASRRARSSFR